MGETEEEEVAGEGEEDVRGERGGTAGRRAGRGREGEWKSRPYVHF